MCGTLKHEKRVARLGDLVPVFALNTERQGTAAWSGHAQEEKLISYWYQQHCVPVQLLVDQFTEDGIAFTVPGGRIQAIGLKRDIVVRGRIIGKEGSVRVVTRAASSDYEKLIHSRWPLIHYPRDANNPYIFTKHDAVQIPLF